LSQAKIWKGGRGAAINQVMISYIRLPLARITKQKKNQIKIKTINKYEKR